MNLLRPNLSLVFAVALMLVTIPDALYAADIATLNNGFEIRHERREVVGPNTRLYPSADGSRGYVDVPTSQIVSVEHDDSIESRDSGSTQSSNTASSRTPARKEDVDAAVKAASETHAIDSDMIASIIHAESSFNPRAVSPKGAQGLMQLMPGTASKLGVNDSFDPKANVDGGTKYFRELLIRYHDDVVKALAAYNAGPQRVDQYNGVPPYRETRNYVARIINEYNRKKAASAKTSPKSSIKARAGKNPKIRSAKLASRSRNIAPSELTTGQ